MSGPLQKGKRDRSDEVPIKILFFILTRIDGKSKRLDLNKEVICDERRA